MHFENDEKKQRSNGDTSTVPFDQEESKAEIHQSLCLDCLK